MLACLACSEEIRRENWNRKRNRRKIRMKKKEKKKIAMEKAKPSVRPCARINRKKKTVCEDKQREGN